MVVLVKRNGGPQKKGINYVFIISLLLTVGLAVWSIVFNESFTVASNALSGFLTFHFGWLYLLAMMVFVFFSLYVAFSRYGTIKLGPDDSVPEYKTSSWFAMLFGAGMGVGLVFWGVSEPISHYMSPYGMEGQTLEAADFAMRTTFMHWGVHPWASYCIIGLALGYFQFRKNKPGLLSSIYSSWRGEGFADSRSGKAIDILAVFATVAGIITSLGLGVRQINSGLNYLFGIPETLTVQIIIMVVITALFIMVAVAGIEKGVKLISDFNLYLAFGLMAAALLVGPGISMINNLVNGMGQYIGNFFQDSFLLSALGDNSWVNDWRIFYWAWWITWAPFVGSFIARISRGRTIRQFILGVMIAPTLGSAVWFAIFGTMGINLGVNEILPQEILNQIVAAPEKGLFLVLGEYPFGMILAFAALVLLCTFFIISANSGTFVLAMMSSNGDLNPPESRKVLWGIVLAAMAIGVLICGLKPLPMVAIAAFPFIFIMLSACVSIMKALKQERQ